MNKSRKKTPKAIIEAAFSNYIDDKVPECFSLLSEISASDLVGLDKSLFQKTQILLLVGEFFGILKESALNALSELAKKSESSWSRAAVSLVIDDSIFKHWLTHGKVDPATAEYFDRYFSGQSKSVVYGFRITLCGLAIEDTFYPMYFALTKKTDNTRQIACDLLNQAHKDITLMCKKEKVTIPNLFLSVDSGFHGLELLNLCATFATTTLPITLVCVPKNNHIIEIQATKETPEFRGKLPEFIDKHFKIAEAKFYEDPNNRNNKDEHFTMRLKINYVSVDTELIILIFRFKKSQKVSVIYTTDLNIKAKTLRHRWFQRTHIEQFFRILKDTLKIQLSKSTDKNGFVKKLCIKLFQALHIQLFRNYCRKRFRFFRKMAFPTIRLLMIANLNIYELLKKCSM